MTTIDDELARNYLNECEQHLALLETGLLKLERGGAEANGKLVNNQLHAVRSMRAGATLFGLAQIGELARWMELVLTPLALDGGTPSPRKIGVLLRAIDTLRTLADDPEASDDADISAIVDALAGEVTVDRSLPQHAPNRRLRMLLAEDDFTNRLLLQTFLSRYGECHVAVNGREAVAAFQTAIQGNLPYDLICMDIMMPELDGGEALRQIRTMEENRGILSTKGAKIIMTTAVKDLREVMHSFQNLCDAYIVKPIDLAQLLGHMKSYDLVK